MNHLFTYWWLYSALCIVIGFLIRRQWYAGIKTIDGKELQELLEQSTGAFLIDVRKPHEYENGHIEGFLNIPLSQLPALLHNLPKEEEIILICRSGRRSLIAARILKRAGFQHVVNVKRGLIGWFGHLTQHA